MTTAAQSLPEIDWLRRKDAQLKDKWVLNQVMTAAFKPLVRFAMSKVRNLDRAEDIAQAVILKGIETAANFRNEAPPLAWLSGIAINFIRNEYRESTKHPTQSIDEDPSMPLQIEALADPITRSATFDAGVVLSLLEDEGDKKLLMMKHVLELSIEEIAHATECTEDSVKMRIFRARQEIASKFKEQNDNHHSIRKRIPKKNGHSGNGVDFRELLAATRADLPAEIKPKHIREYEAKWPAPVFLSSPPDIILPTPKIIRESERMAELFSEGKISMWLREHTLPAVGQKQQGRDEPPSTEPQEEREFPSLVLKVSRQKGILLAL